MKNKKIGLIYRGKRFVIDVKRCNLFGRFRGLMFRKSKDSEALLLFDSDNSVGWGIHSLFVSFPFVALWLDDKNKIIEKRVVKPFTLSIKPRKSFNKLVEIPLNGRYGNIVKILCSPTVIRKIYKEKRH